MGTEGSTAQVHPGKLTKAFMKAAEGQGASLRIGTVTGLDFSASEPRRVQGMPQRPGSGCEAYFICHLARGREGAS